MSENRIFSYCLSAGVLVLLLGILAVVSIWPESSREDQLREYAVVFKPGILHREAIDKVVSSGGMPVRSGAFDFVLIAASADDAFLEYIKMQGAMLVFSPVVKGGCFVQNKAVFKKQV